MIVPLDADGNLITSDEARDLRYARQAEIREKLAGNVAARGQLKAQDLVLVAVSRRLRSEIEAVVAEGRFARQVQRGAEAQSEEREYYARQGCLHAWVAGEVGTSPKEGR